MKTINELLNERIDELKPTSTTYRSYTIFVDEDTGEMLKHFQINNQNYIFSSMKPKIYYTKKNNYVEKTIIRPCRRNTQLGFKF